MAPFRRMFGIAMFTLAASWAVVGMGVGSANVNATAADSPPPISALLRPAEFKKVLDEREVITHAALEDSAPQPLKRYSIQAGMLVKAETALTRRILTDYSLYAKMIPYVDRAVFQKDTQILQIEGGIWKFKLSSLVKFEERASNWIHYRIVGGHFTGLSGDILFESRGERGTAVFMNGALAGTNWPPKFVIERGAEIVFGYTAKRMRSYIESQKKEETYVDSHGEVPQPRSHLRK